MQIAICLSTRSLHHHLVFFSSCCCCCCCCVFDPFLDNLSFDFLLSFGLSVLGYFLFAEWKQKHIFSRFLEEKFVDFSFLFPCFCVFNRRTTTTANDAIIETRATSAKVFVQLAKQESFDRKTFLFKQKLIHERWESERERLSADKKNTAKAASSLLWIFSFEDV